MTLKEILAERKRKQEKEVSADTETKTQETTPTYTFHGPTSEYYALFEGCTDF